MHFTDTLGLPCPDSTDYALLPIYMQDLAETLEAKILAQRATITAVDTQPVAIFQNPSALGPNGAGSMTGFISLGQIVFRNYSLTGGGTPQFYYFPGQTFPRSGIYTVGYWMNGFSNTGAVGDLTKRKIYCRVIRTSSSGVITVLADITSEIIASSATNGEALAMIGTVAITDQDLPLVGILMGWVHNDATSSVNFPALAMTAFIQRIGSTDLIEVT